VRPVPLNPGHVDAVLRFVSRLEDSDLAFISEQADDPDTVAKWGSGQGRGRHWVVLDENDSGEPEVIALTAVVPMRGWASHVGELRLVVRPDRRGQGLGQQLIRFGLVEAVRMELLKVQVDVVADAEQRVAMFTELGFTPEALLADVFRTRSGELHDLMILSYPVAQRLAEVAQYGTAEALSAS
jgi:GNAT superfamily N-acetyltransferase